MRISVKPESADDLKTNALARAIGKYLSGGRLMEQRIKEAEKRNRTRREQLRAIDERIVKEAEAKRQRAAKRLSDEASRRRQTAANHYVWEYFHKPKPSPI